MDSLPIGGMHVADNMALADVGSGWLIAGAQIYSQGLGLIAWRYDGDGVSIAHQQMLGRQMLAAGTVGGSKGRTVLVGVATGAGLRHAQGDAEIRARNSEAVIAPVVHAHVGLCRHVAGNAGCAGAVDRVKMVLG